MGATTRLDVDRHLRAPLAVQQGLAWGPQPPYPHMAAPHTWLGAFFHCLPCVTPTLLDDSNRLVTRSESPLKSAGAPFVMRRSGVRFISPAPLLKPSQLSWLGGFFRSWQVSVSTPSGEAKPRGRASARPPRAGSWQSPLPATAWARGHACARSDNLVADLADIRLDGSGPHANSRMTRQGLPAASTPAGTSRVTTLPAPITARSPT